MFVVFMFGIIYTKSTNQMRWHPKGWCQEQAGLESLHFHHPNLVGCREKLQTETDISQNNFCFFLLINDSLPIETPSALCGDVNRIFIENVGS